MRLDCDLGLFLAQNLTLTLKIYGARRGPGRYPPSLAGSQWLLTLKYSVDGASGRWPRECTVLLCGCSACLWCQQQSARKSVRPR
jgi:hypothetical protein